MLMLKFTKLGSGLENIIVIHDWFSDISSYETMEPFLNTEDYTYYFVDLRGYGNSKDINGNCTIEEAAADIVALADQEKLNKFHLIGHSMSGMIVQYVDTIIPERLKSIICITPVPASGSPVPEDVNAFLIDAANSNDTSAKEIVQMMTGNRYSDTFLSYKVARWRQTSYPEARIAYLEMFSQTDFSDKVKGTQTPYLVIVGANDAEGHSKEVMQQTFGKWMKNYSIEIFSGSGHYPMQEEPVLLADTIETFVRKNSV